MRRADEHSSVRSDAPVTDRGVFVRGARRWLPLTASKGGEAFFPFRFYPDATRRVAIQPVSGKEQSDALVSN